MTEVIPVSDVDVRVTSQAPHGGNMTKVDAIQVAELGALMGALGAERGAMTHLFQEFQSATIQTWMTHMPSLLNRIREWERARFNRLIQAVRAMPEANVQGLMSRLMANPNTSPRSLVDREQVIQLIVAVMEDTPAAR